MVEERKQSELGPTSGNAGEEVGKQGGAWLWKNVIGPALTPFERWLQGGWVRVAISAWLICLWGGWWFVRGRQVTSSVRSPWLWVVTGAGLVTILGIAKWRERIRPAVLVAQFHPQGGATGADAGELQSRVVDALATTAEESWCIEKSQLQADVGDHRERDRLISEASSAGFGVAIGANVRLSEGELAIRWAVLPAARRARRLRLTALDSRKTEIDLGQAHVRGFKSATADEVAALARIAAGIALLTYGKALEAAPILETVKPPTYLSLLYSAYAALLLEDWDRARERAAAACGLEKRPAAIAVKAISEAERGRLVVAVRTFSTIRDPDTLADVPAVMPGDDPVPRLPLVAQVRLTGEIVADAADGIVKFYGGVEDAIKELRRELGLLNAEYKARRAMERGDAVAALRILEVSEESGAWPRWLMRVRHDGHRREGLLRNGLRPEGEALHARLLALTEQPSVAAERARQAEEELSPPLDPEETQPWQDVAVAYAQIGDGLSSLRILQKVLPWLDQVGRAALVLDLQGTVSWPAVKAEFGWLADI